MGRPVVRTALDVPIIDVGAFFTSGAVEGALQELGASGGGGGGATFAQNVLTITSDGQTAFILSTAYVGVGGLSIVIVNGLVYVEGVDYTIGPGTAFTWLDACFTLKTTDTLVVKFQTA